MRWKRKSRLVRFALVSLFAALLAGCSPQGEGKVDSVRILRGAGQSALPGKPFPVELVLELTDSGGDPVADCAVTVEAEPGSELTTPERVLRSDAGGVVRIPVTAGRKLGDNYLRITPEGAERRSLVCRFVTGIELLAGRREGAAGGRLADPVAVRLVDSGGAPVAGREVYFEPVRAPEGGSLQFSHSKVLTDRDGVAATRVTLGEATGVYGIEIKPAGQDGGLLTRGVTVEVMGLNLWSLLIGAFAGLAIFVFGMHLMSDGLQKTAGEKMKTIIQLFARNRFIGLLAGAGVTAVIQSSSATTVMVIGFINAGLLNLAQSIGIIFGTNIGTTITAQIVSFDISALALPAIIVGLLLFFIPYRNCRGIGETVLGFGFLFLGMVMMSDELTRIADFRIVTDLFARFDCTPVDGVMPFGAVLGALLIGLVVTMIIQSSSASTGIVIALGAGGLINLYTAMPLVLGANIGTTVTAQLAAIPANRVAKQAALAHTLFNVIGTVVMLVFFYVPWGSSGIPVFFHIVDAVTPGDAFGAVAQNVPRHIANAHTLFNVFTAILLLPFVMPMARVCERLIPVRKKVKYTSLDPYLLENPPIALHQAVGRLRTLTRGAWHLLGKCTENVLDGRSDGSKREEFRKRTARIERIQQEITSYLTQLAQRPLTAEQSAAIPVLTRCVNDAECLADYAGQLARESARFVERRGKLSKKTEKELRELLREVGRMADHVFDSLEFGQTESVALVRELAPEIRSRIDRMEELYLESLRKGTCNAESGIVFLALTGILRQACGRLENIALLSSALGRYEWTGNPHPVRRQ
ncbi:Na/Pi symporter [uncultured Victivallis sp.]|uniref:Na/Pi symporter n=1 Tax=uncultured Victivallis sp. TaxID=354118 RepID=UPI0025E625BF|nr:Na/Pi symporter [uncultured Victivallis sp.]